MKTKILLFLSIISILTISLLTPTTVNASAWCKYSHVINLDKWRYTGAGHHSLVGDVTKLIQVVKGRYLVFDNMNIVVDLDKVHKREVRRGERLRDLVHFMGSIGYPIWQDVNGFDVEISMYEPITRSQYMNCNKSKRWE